MAEEVLGAVRYIVETETETENMKPIRTRTRTVRLAA